MASSIKLKNGIPYSYSPYDASYCYTTGLSSSTTVTLYSSGFFEDSLAKDMLVIVNDQIKEVSRDFSVVGAGPTYTQIQFSYDLPNYSVVRFIKISN